MNRRSPLRRPHHSLFSLRGYFYFFMTVALVATSSLLLFLHSTSLDEEIVRQSAPVTFFNILFISLLFTLVDGFRRKWSFERPIKRILSATQRLSAGEYNVRIDPLHIPESMNEFDLIIESINKLAAELNSVETLRSDFVSNVSHELKTPLTVMQNYGTMLQQPGLPEEKRLEYARSITAASRRLSDLITNILKLNRLENQQIYPEAVSYNLSEQLLESLLVFEDALDQKELELETDIPDNVIIQADTELLSTVWNNLISNAIKFSDNGGKISVRLQRKQQGAVVVISDTGCGMSPETGAHIFEKFYQGDTSHATQGNGLGLALVKRVIDIVGGDISVKSETGKGSTFTVQLWSNGSGEN